MALVEDPAEVLAQEEVLVEVLAPREGLAEAPGARAWARALAAAV